MKIFKSENIIQDAYPNDTIILYVCQKNKSHLEEELPSILLPQDLELCSSSGTPDLRPDDLYLERCPFEQAYSYLRA